MIGALHFGHLPAVFVPGGPMTVGPVEQGKGARAPAATRKGKATREELLECEAASYHGAGTCTFYGTANSNQMLMEVMGLHLPGAAFINPGTPLRDALTGRGARDAPSRSATLGGDYTPIGRVVDEKRIVNAIVGLLATGGSTNHTHAPGGDRARGRHRHRLGRLSTSCRPSCRCWPASTRTATPT